MVFKLRWMENTHYTNKIMYIKNIDERLIITRKNTYNSSLPMQRQDDNYQSLSKQRNEHDIQS
jgi:hypothetical protein